MDSIQFCDRRSGGYSGGAPSGVAERSVDLLHDIPHHAVRTRGLLDDNAGGDGLRPGRAIVRLAPGAKRDAKEALEATFSASGFSDRLQAAPIRTTLVGGAAGSLWLLQSAALVLLVIAPRQRAHLDSPPTRGNDRAHSR